MSGGSKAGVSPTKHTLAPGGPSRGRFFLPPGEPPASRCVAFVAPTGLDGANVCCFPCFAPRRIGAGLFHYRGRFTRQACSHHSMLAHQQRRGKKTRRARDAPGIGGAPFLVKPVRPLRLSPVGRAMTDALFALIICGLLSGRSPPGSSFLAIAAPAMNAADALAFAIRAALCAIALVMLILVVLDAARRH
jgi:hypothetical protein